jgi:integrase/recombinase XerD
VRFVQLSGRAERTQEIYLQCIRRLARRYPDTDIVRLGKDDVLDYLIYLQEERKLEGSTVNQAKCALRAFYRDHLGHDWDIWKKIKIRRNEPLPHILSRDEVALLLRTFRDARYRAFCTVVYQCGLRLSEALHIKVTDIDGERLVIRIPHGKGDKAREVPISADLLVRLRNFWKAHCNPVWLFPGTGRGWKGASLTLRQALHACPKPMSKAGVWQAISVAKAECGLARRHEKLCTHTLRHSYATHMIEGGASVRQVAAYLGHSTLKQVMVFLHLTEISEQKARVALATLPMPGEDR